MPPGQSVRFTIKGMRHEARYGFAINSVSDTIWESGVNGAVSLGVGSSLRSVEATRPTRPCTARILD